jgi:hypothetical protein
MSIKRFKSSSAITGSKSSKVWDQETTLNDYQSIATYIVGSGGASSITFSNIPSTYTHLQIRGIVRNTSHSAGGAEQNLRMQFNGDTASNYSAHTLYGDGSSAGASVENTTSILVAWGFMPMDTQTANVYGASIVDILEYGNTNKYKTNRALCGDDTNGGGYMFLTSGSWRNTAAITSINLYPQAGTFAQYSQLALYGVKA